MRRSTVLRRLAQAAACVLLAAAGTGAAAEEIQLKAVTPWARNFFISQSFQRYIDKLNAAGKGVVRINYIGGPEALPATEQGSALRTGVIDLYYGSAAYMQGDLPEADALAGSTRTPAEARANGGYDILDEIVQKKMNAKFIAHVDTGWAFIIFLTQEPKRGPTGSIDLAGMKLRSHPLYRDFLSSLHAENLMIPAGEINTAFERNMVQGLAFSEIGIRDLGLEKYVKYRVSPKFYQSDIVMLINLTRWRAMPEAARALIMKTALAHEEESGRYFVEEVRNEMARLDALGIKEIRLTGGGADEYLSKARSVPWARMAKADPTNVERLKAKFYQP